MDLDAFFASCEQLEQPEYRGLPVVVGTRPGHRGVVAAASYEARRFGIHSAMPIAEAFRRCPDAVYLRPDMVKYQRYSAQVFQILETITPAVEAASIDEAYLDVSGLEKLSGTAEAIGREIKQRIHTETGLTASVGIGPNRLIAKLGSEFRKPDGLTVVTPEQALGFPRTHAGFQPPWTGKTDPEDLQPSRHQDGGTTAHLPLRTLEQHLGEKAAASFHRQASASHRTRSCRNQRRKSISKETTFEADIRDHTVLHDALRRAGGRCGKNGTPGGIVGLCRDPENPLHGIRYLYAAIQTRLTDL